MPDLNEILEKRKKKKFVKKEYRPWDLTGVNNENHLPNVESNSKPVLKHQPLEVDNNLHDKEILEKPTSSLDNIKITDRRQKDNVKVAFGNHKDNIKITNKQHLDNVKESKEQHIDNNLDNKNHIESVKKLTGIQRNIFLYIVEICCARGELETGNILTTDIMEFVNCSYGSIKMSLKRLVDKGLIIRYPGKRSKGGFLNLGITKEIRSAALTVERDKQFIPVIHKQILQRSYELGNKLDNNTETYINNSNKNIIITNLPKEWQGIDFSPLQEIGFTESHLNQIYQSKKNTPDIVQQSIHHFSFALEHRRGEIEKKYKGALNAIMSVLVKGNSWYESTYESPQEKSLRLFLENKRKRELNIKTMIDELVVLEFPKWRNKLSDNEVANIVPEQTLNSKIKTAIEVSLKTFYIDHVLKPKMREEGVLLEE